MRGSQCGWSRAGSDARRAGEKPKAELDRVSLGMKVTVARAQFAESGAALS